MNQHQEFARQMINQLDAIQDVANAPAFKVKVALKDELNALQFKPEQILKLVGEMDIRVSQEAFEALGEPMMLEVVRSVAELLDRYDTASIKAGLGPLQSAVGMSIVFT